MGFASTAPLSTPSAVVVYCVHTVFGFFLPCDHSFVFGLLKWNRGTVYIYELVVFKRELIKECLKNIE